MEIHLWLEGWSRWLWPWVFLHLWETTLFFGLVALAVRFLRRAPAGTRYFFWLAAAVKLLVPSLFLGWLISDFPLGVTVSPPPSLEESTYGTPFRESEQPVYKILEPLLPGQLPATQPQLEGAQQGLYSTLTLIWATGFLFSFFAGRGPTFAWPGPSGRPARWVQAGKQRYSDECAPGWR